MPKPEDPNQDYDVGFGKPPKHSRFKKGKSGNPRGRPKGSKNKPPTDSSLRTLLLDEANRQLSLHENGKPITMSVVQAIIRSMQAKAFKGNVPAQKALLDLIQQAEQEALAEQLRALSAAFDYKHNAHAAIKHAKDNDLPFPDEWEVHPDDIIIDYETMKVDIIDRKSLFRDKGISTKSDWLQERSAAQEHIREMKKQAPDNIAAVEPDQNYIKQCDLMIELIDAINFKDTDQMTQLMTKLRSIGPV